MTRCRVVLFVILLSAKNQRARHGQDGAESEVSEVSVAWSRCAVCRHHTAPVECVPCDASVVHVLYLLARVAGGRGRHDGWCEEGGGIFLSG